MLYKGKITLEKSNEQTAGTRGGRGGGLGILLYFKRWASERHSNFKSLMLLSLGATVVSPNSVRASSN